MGVGVCVCAHELRWLQDPDMNSCWKMKIQVQIIVLDGVAVVDVCLCAISVDAADVVVVIAFNAAASGMYALCSAFLKMHSRSFIRYVQKKR